MSRHNLYMFRHDRKLAQYKMADMMGVSRATYCHIEKGIRQGSVQFWFTLKRTFNLTDEEIYDLMKIEEKEDEVAVSEENNDQTA